MHLKEELDISILSLTIQMNSEQQHAYNNSDLCSMNIKHLHTDKVEIEQSS